jgi:hypothetical protein
MTPERIEPKTPVLDVELLPEQIDSATALRDEDYYDARPPHHG